MTYGDKNPKRVLVSDKVSGAKKCQSVTEAVKVPVTDVPELQRECQNVTDKVAENDRKFDQTYES